MEEFSSNEVYRTFDYSLSHKLLLIRSTEIIKDIPYNTDIVFEGVFYMEIPDYFNGLSIRKADLKEYNYVKKRSNGFKKDFYRVYTITTSKKDYFVGCTGFLIQKNNLLPLNSSLFPDSDS